jgi:hypothetical protein
MYELSGTVDLSRSTIMDISRLRFSLAELCLYAHAYQPISVLATETCFDKQGALVLSELSSVINNKY